MAAKVLDGNLLAEKILKHLKDEIEKKNLHLKLGIILVGNDPASRIYIQKKQVAASKIGAGTEAHRLPEDTTESELLKAIDRFNVDPSINGIIVQLPLPGHLRGVKIGERIDPKKDVDGLNPASKFMPATALAVKIIIEEEKLTTSGKHAVVIGRSKLVGLPIANLLLQMDATVTICHSKTSNLSQYTKTADILVAATGRPNLITADMVKAGVIALTIGITRNPDGSLAGDIRPEVATKALFYTPVPGGIGPLTVTSLMSNLVQTSVTQRQSHGNTTIA